MQVIEVQPEVQNHVQNMEALSYSDRLPSTVPAQSAFHSEPDFGHDIISSK